MQTPTLRNPSLWQFDAAFREPPPDGRIMFSDAATLLTVRGRRAENQDRAFAALIHAKDAHAVFVACVLDGMGGMRSGGEAAGLAAGAFLDALIERSDKPLSERLATALIEANAAVWQQLRREGGTTLSAVAIDENNQTLCVHVGDSRIYAYDGAGAQVTTDDTLSGLLGRDPGEFSDQGLMQFVGIGKTMLHQSFDLSSRPPATLLLTSDGFHNLYWRTDAEMFDPSRAAFARLAHSWDLDDNATAIIVDVRKAAQSAKAAGCAEHGIQVTSTSEDCIVREIATKQGDESGGV